MAWGYSIFGLDSGKQFTITSNEAGAASRALKTLCLCQRQMTQSVTGKTNVNMVDPKCKPAPLAYQNEPFLNSPEGRILRILSEYSEPLSRFRREQIQDTVAFFGSARFYSKLDAQKRLTGIEAAAGEGASAEQNLQLKQAVASFFQMPTACLWASTRTP